MFYSKMLFHSLFSSELNKIFVIILRTKVKIFASAIYIIWITIILVCLSYKEQAHNFLAKVYQLRKSMDIRYSVEKLSV